MIFGSNQKKETMRRVTLLTICLFLSVFAMAQNDKLGQLEQMEDKAPPQDPEYETIPATIKTTCRFFSDMDNLSSVMGYLQSGKEILVLGQTETYFLIRSDSTEGFVFKEKVDCPLCAPAEGEEQPVTAGTEQTQQNRYAYLKEKYGDVADELYANKIWKGMTTEMVLDSWGKPQKITRNITSRKVQEEWVFKRYWLFFENDRLLDWGTIR